MDQTTSPKPTKKELKRQKSSGMKSYEEQQRKDAKRSMIIKSGIVAAVLVGVIGVLAAVVLLKPAASALPGTEYPIEGREHVTEGTQVDYKTNPPSSGNHYATPADWGVYTQQLKDEQVVHNLEHGGIWISYRDANDKELVEKLTALAKRFQTKLVLEPRPQNPAPIALVSWGWVQLLDNYDEQAIINFYNAHKNKGPENVPDMGI